jgi:uncharacterized protein (TIGR02145 family)
MEDNPIYPKNRILNIKTTSMKSIQFLLIFFIFNFFLFSCNKEKITPEEVGINDIYTEVFEYKDNVIPVDKSFLDEIVSSDDSILIMNNTPYIRNILKEGVHIVTDLSKLSLVNLICIKVNKVTINDNKVLIAFENAYLSDVYNKLNYFEKPNSDLLPRTGNCGEKCYEFELKDFEVGGDSKFNKGNLKDLLKDNKLYNIGVENVKGGAYLKMESSFQYRLWIEGNNFNQGIYKFKIKLKSGIITEGGIDEVIPLFTFQPEPLPQIFAFTERDLSLKIKINGKLSFIKESEFAFHVYHSTNNLSKESQIVIGKINESNENNKSDLDITCGVALEGEVSVVPKIKVTWGFPDSYIKLLPREYNFLKVNAGLSFSLPLKFSASISTNSKNGPCSEYKTSLSAQAGTFLTFFGKELRGEDFISYKIYENYWNNIKCEIETNPNVAVFRVNCNKNNNESFREIELNIWNIDENFNNISGKYHLYNRLDNSQLMNSSGSFEFDFNYLHVIKLPYSDNTILKYVDINKPENKGILSKNIINYLDACKEFGTFGCRNFIPDEKVKILDKSYNCNIIGNQIWFKENLKVAGPEQEEVEFTKNTDNYYTWVNLFNSNVKSFYSSGTELYSTLSNWNAETQLKIKKSKIINYQNLRSNIINNPKGLCPDGWHVPSKSEWEELINHVKLRKSYDNANDSYFIEYFKARNTWDSNALDDSPIPFCAEPSGFAIRKELNTPIDIKNLKEEVAIFWTSTPDETRIGNMIAIQLSKTEIKFISAIYNMKFNCRCIKD